MPTITRAALATALALGLSACADVTAPTEAARSGAPAPSAVKFWDANATANWQELATSIQARRRVGPVFRLYAYLSLAQLRAAQDAAAIEPHPPTSAAIGAASAEFLTTWFPLDADEIRAALVAQAAATPWSGAKHEDFAVGEAIGRAAAARVLEYSRGDRVGLASPGAPPPGAGYWTGTSPARGGYKARPFFLESDDELRPVPPPVVGSAEFTEAVAEVLQISLNRTPEQIAIANYWAVNQSAAIDAAMNNLAVDLLRSHRRSDAESARIMFLMSAAAMDANIACFNAKYDFWYIRPKQAMPAVATLFNAPNHPSYPSGHSCNSGAATGVLASVFPSERARLEQMAEEASLSRLYAGIHYRFDMVAGLALGRAAATKAIASDLGVVAVR